MIKTAIATGALALAGVLGAAPAAADAVLSHEASLEDGRYASIQVSSGPELAGEQLSVLVLTEDAALDAPAAADVVYIEQLVLDADGDAALRVRLPSAALGEYYLALNTTGGTDRYVAPLGERAVEVPTDEPEPTTPPTSAPEPTDGPTDGPTGAPSPTDGATDGPTVAEPGPTSGTGDGSPSPGNGSGADGTAGGDAGTDGGLSRTGAPVALVTGIAIAALLAGAAGVLAARARGARG